MRWMQMRCDANAMRCKCNRDGMRWMRCTFDETRWSDGGEFVGDGRRVSHLVCCQCISLLCYGIIV